MIKLLETFAALVNEPARSRRLVRIGRSLFLTGLVCGSIVSVRGQKHPTRAEKPDAAALEVKRGKLLYAKNDFAGAIASFSKAIELRPDWTVAYVERGTARRAQGELDLAIKDFDKALELDEKSVHNNRTVAEAYVNHGQIRRNNLHIEAALIDYNRAVTVFPTLTRTYLERGQAFLLADAFDRAIADLNYFIENEKFDPFSKALAYADRSLVKRLRGKTLEAAGDFQESLKLMKSTNGGEKIIQDHLAEIRVQLEILRRTRRRRPEKVA